MTPTTQRRFEIGRDVALFLGSLSVLVIFVLAGMLLAADTLSTTVDHVREGALP